MSALHDDALRTLEGWTAPDPGQEGLRRRFLDLLATGPGSVLRGGGPEHLTASALVVDAAGERTLLALHRKGNFWVQPGGHGEPSDPTLAAAALREATEESGIAYLQLLPDPVDLDRHDLPPAFGGCRTHWDVRFVALAPRGSVAAVSEESHELRWFGYDALPDGAVDDLARLVRAARRALVEPGGAASRT